MRHRTLVPVPSVWLVGPLSFALSGPVRAVTAAMTGHRPQTATLTHRPSERRTAMEVRPMEVRPRQAGKTTALIEMLEVLEEKGLLSFIQSKSAKFAIGLGVSFAAVALNLLWVAQDALLSTFIMDQISLRLVMSLITSLVCVLIAIIGGTRLTIHIMRKSVLKTDNLICPSYRMERGFIRPSR